MLTLVQSWSGIVLAVGLVVVMSGCGGAPQFPRAAVRGNVSIAGQPLVSGIVRFSPADGKGPAVVAMISNGSYSLTAKEGPVVGENIVEIDGSPVLPGMELDDEAAYAKMIIDGGGSAPKNPVPSQYRRSGSPLRKVIEAAKENEANFPLEAEAQVVSPESNF
jgi:hypothetical protein